MTPAEKLLTPAQRLLIVTPETSSVEIAKLIADKMIFYSKTEWYRFRINHDIGPPLCQRCPVTYDWSSKGHVGMETTNKAHARKWLTEAAFAGYRIEEIDIKRKPTNARTESIEAARNRAQLHQYMESRDNDDDIPF